MSINLPAREKGPVTPAKIGLSVINPLAISTALKLSFVLFALYLVIYLTAESNDAEKLCFNTLVENVRSFSSEIEYSENNLNAILDKIEGDIFISKNN